MHHNPETVVLLCVMFFCLFGAWGTMMDLRRIHRVLSETIMYPPTPKRKTVVMCFAIGMIGAIVRLIQITQ